MVTTKYVNTIFCYEICF